MKHYNGSADIIDVYLDTSEESIDEVEKALEDLGINPERLTNHFDYLIRKEEAKLKLDEGKAIQERFNIYFVDRSISDIRNKLKDKIGMSKSAQFAFNKLDGLDENSAKELLDDELKLIILKELGQIDGKGEENSDQ